jgi:predicted GIY-YIG superfamily endonuclease
LQHLRSQFVYILRGEVDPNRHYVGATSDVDRRLEWHHHSPCGHTAEHRPWLPVVAIEFPTEKEWLRFERYLKSGSGRAIANRHFGLSRQLANHPASSPGGYVPGRSDASSQG